MAKINKQNIYSPDQTVSREDNWVGTDYQDFNKTKTFFVGNILDYIMLNYGGTEQNNFVTEKTLGVINTSVENALIDTLNALETYTVAANEIIMYTGDILGVQYNTKFVYVLKAGKGSYGIGGIELATTDILLLNPVQEEAEATTTIINNIISQDDKILFGNIVHDTGLTFRSTNVGFIISGEYKYENGKLITLDTPDIGEVNSRTDVFVLDVRTSGIQVLKGIPAASPQERSLENPYQLRFSAVRVNPAGVPEVIPNPGDTPTAITTVQIYNENLGEPDEWTSGVIGGTGSFNSTAHPQLGSKCVFLPTTEEPATVEFKLSSATPITHDASSNLIFALWSQGTWVSTTRLTITIKDSLGTESTQSFGYLQLRNYGNNNLAVNTWQIVSIPLSVFTTAPVTFDTITFNAFENPNWYFDDIKVQSGVTIDYIQALIPTKTSQLINDGEDGLSRFVQENEISNLVLMPPYLRELVPDTYLPSTTGNFILRGSFFVPDMVITIEGHTINYQTFVSSNEFIVNLTTSATEGFYDVTLDNGLVAVFADQLQVINGTVYAPSTEDWTILTGSLDIERNDVKLITKDVSGTARNDNPIYLLNTANDWRLDFKLTQSALEANPYINYVVGVLGIKLVDATSGIEQYRYDIYKIGDSYRLWYSMYEQISTILANPFYVHPYTAEYGQNLSIRCVSGVITFLRNNAVITTASYIHSGDMKILVAAREMDVTEIKYIDLSDTGGGYTDYSKLISQFTNDSQYIRIADLTQYADDTAAGVGGVAIGGAYIKSSTGAIHSRLT